MRLRDFVIKKIWTATNSADLMTDLMTKCLSGERNSELMSSMGYYQQDCRHRLAPQAAIQD